MDKPEDSQPPVDRLVMPLTMDVLEQLMTIKSNSYPVGHGYSIAWVCGWKVYYRAIDATYRLAVGSGSAVQEGFTFMRFRDAWLWLEQLTPWQREMIEVESTKSPSA